MDRAKFFAELRKTLFKGGLSQEAVNSFDAILDRTVGRGLPVAHVAYMMATAYHESGSTMIAKTENLNYTTAARIKAVWPTRFATNAAAQPYVRNPQKLANFVYGGRLGNTGSNDGWSYRGRGLVQITGKTNYAKMKKYIGKDAVTNPDLMLDAKNSAIALVECMIDGVYTGKKLSDYKLPGSYFDARAIINADKNRLENGVKIGTLIANYAKHFETSLKVSGFATPGIVITKPPADLPVTPNVPTPDVDNGVPGWIQYIMKMFILIFGKK